MKQITIQFRSLKQQALIVSQLLGVGNPGAAHVMVLAHGLMRLPSSRWQGLQRPEGSTGEGFARKISHMVVNRS